MYTPGQFSFDAAGKGWVYVQAQAFVHIHRACRLDTPSFHVERIATTNDREGDRVCIAELTFDAGDWGWMQVYGFGRLDVQGPTVSHTAMRTTPASNAGRLRDGTVSSGQIAGITLLETTSGSRTARAVFNWPYVAN